MLISDSLWRMAPVVLTIGFLFPVLVGTGCPGPDDGTDIVGKQSPIATILVSGIVNHAGETITLTGKGSGGQGNYVYAWSPDPSIEASEIEGSLNAEEIRFTPSRAGGYRFNLAVTDAGGQGRTATDSVVVVVYDQVSVQVDAMRMVTLGAPAVFQATPGGGDGVYKVEWRVLHAPSDDYTFTDTDTFTPRFKPMTRGRYVFEVVVKDGGGEGQEARAETAAVTPGNTGLLNLAWEANYDAGGYKVEAVFDEQLEKATAERPEHYRVSGTDVVPSQAVLLPDGQRVELIFETPMGRTSRVDLSVDGAILDISGAPVAPVMNQAIAANERDILVPEIAGATWKINQIDKYRYDVVFSEAMDRDAVEDPFLYRTTRTDTPAASATLGNDGRTVAVAFSNMALSTNTEFDIGVEGPIKDINGRAMPSSLKYTVQPNAADADPPRVVAGTIMHAPDFSRGGYKITVVFNEVMSKNEVELSLGWEVNGYQPNIVNLGRDGRTVDLRFYSPLSITDQMDVGLVGALRDINQNPVTLLNSQVILPSPEDANRPRVVIPTPRYSVNWGGGGYRVELDFSEAMDNASVTELTNYRRVSSWFSTVFAREPSMAELDAAFYGFTFASRGYLIWYDTLGWQDYVNFPPDPEIMHISLGDSIVDINGRMMLERRNVWIEQNQLDTEGPYITSLLWGVDRPEYTVIVKFDEAMDSGTTWRAPNYLITQGGDEDEDNLRNPDDVEPAVDGMTVTLTWLFRGEGFQSGPDDDNPPDQLFIAEPEWDGQALIRGLRDINLQLYPWAALDDDEIITVIGQNPADTRRPEIIGTPTFESNRGPIVIEFDEVLNLRTIIPEYFDIADDAGIPVFPPDDEGNPVNAIEGAILWQDGRTVEVELKEDCPDLAIAYQFIVRGIQDINGNPMIPYTYVIQAGDLP